MKTLAIRLEEDQHAQLSTIAQLQGLTMIDAIRQAINEWVQARRDNPELKQRAEALLDEIEQEAATRRGAIAALINSEPPAESEPPTGESPARAPAIGNGGSRPSGRNRQRGGDEVSG